MLPTHSFAQAGSLDTGFNPGSGANGSVESVTVQPDGKIVLGGYFTTFSGVARNRVARLNADGSLDTSFNPGTGVDGPVFSTAAQGDGKIVLGGSFNSFNGVARNFVTRLNADGSLDTGFNPGTGANNTVRSVTVQADGKIVLGGDFTIFNGVARNRIARLNADGSLDTGFNPGANNTVRSVTVQADGKIVLGGDFTIFNGVARNRIARLNADGNLDTGFNPGSGANDYVESVAVQLDGKIVLGGNFNSFNGVARSNVARLNADGALDTAFTANTFGVVLSIAVQADGKIVLGGSFTQVNGVARNFIARLNVDGSLDTGFNSSVNSGSVSSVAVQPDGKIVLGGFFNGFNAVVRNNVARLNGTTSVFPPVLTSATSVGGVVGQPLSYQLTATNALTGFGVSGSLPPGLSLNAASGLLTGTPTAAGTFPVTFSATNAGGGGTLAVTFNVAAAPAPTPAPGRVTAGFNPGAGADGQVRAVAFLPDGRAVIGGAFSTYLGAPRRGIARVNADGSLDTSFNPGSGTDQPVNALLLQVDGKVVLGGDFTVVNGRPRNGVVRLNADGSLDPDFNAPIAGSGASTNASAAATTYYPPHMVRRATTRAVAIRSGFVTSLSAGPNGTIIVGGAFQQAVNAAVQAVARLTNTGSLDPSFTPASGVPNGAVRATVTQPDGKTIIAGDFSAVGSVPRGGIARLNVDGSLDPSFDASTGAQGGPVDALALQPDGAVVIGGDFTSVDNQRRGRVARVGSNGTLDPSFDPGSGANGTVRAVTRQFDGKLLLGGAFTQIADAVRNAVARLNADGSPDKTFDPGSGANAPVNAIALRQDGSALLGGDFTQVANTPLGRVALIGAGNAPAPTGAVVVSVVGAGPTRGGFVLSRTGSVDAPVTVFYHNGGSAIRDQDYVALPGTATIPAGQSEVVIPVTLLPGANRGKKVKVILDPAPDGSSYGIAKTQSKVFLSDLP